jgi:two-component system sensor histidine kinase PilS (NtrC family)
LWRCIYLFSQWQEPQAVELVEADLKELSWRVVLDFTGSRAQMLIIESVRLGFLVVILIVALAFQAVQPEFVNIDILAPLFWLLFGSFLINGVFLFNLDRWLKFWPATAFLFVTESILISALIYFCGINQSIFVFLYLVNIILCGFVFQRRGAVYLALWTSILFSFLIILGPELKGQTLFFAVGLNNFAFFSVATLAGYLSEQLDFMGRAFKAQGKDLAALKNLNFLIIDNIATGLITIDDAGFIVQANPSSAEILDSTPEKLIGSEIDKIVPGILRRIQSFNLTNEFRRSERFDMNFESSVKGKLNLDITLSALWTEDTLSGYILTFQDITKIRRLELAMRQNEKMAAVGQLAAGIAHEIRNPLASISGSIQLLGSSFTSRHEEEQKLMTIALREVDRLNNLITEFLDFARPDVLRDDPVNINDLLREILEMLKFNKLLRNDVQQNLEFSAVQEIGGHRDKLKQALLNILINAYQAMVDSDSPKIRIETVDKGNLVVIKIRDYGCGIDEAGLKRIFEPFHTTKPKGTGLGLAVTHKIIESHGGKIYVESTKGSGTEFIIEFPARSGLGVDKIALADSQAAAENFSIAFRGQSQHSKGITDEAAYSSRR